MAFMTERVGLLGWPVEHSVSPAMHNAAFAALGLDWQYDLLPVPPSKLEAEIRRLIKEEGYRGFNVTVPHKQAAFRLPRMCEISPAANAIGAVNTLVVQPDGDMMDGENTDWRGFAIDLDEHEIQIAGARCLILGSGGSAQAVVYALGQGGAESVTLVSRRPSKPGEISYNDLGDVAPTVDLIINCTPVGMSPDVDRSPWPEDVPFPPEAVLYDLVYNPPFTRLMVQAESAGVDVTGGLGMLVWQGALAFELWTGIKPPVDVMTEAAREALGIA
jgi:shikimate dehydrogenase